MRVGLQHLFLCGVNLFPRRPPRRKKQTQCGHRLRWRQRTLFFTHWNKICMFTTTNRPSEGLPHERKCTAGCVLSTITPIKSTNWGRLDWLTVPVRRKLATGFLLGLLKTKRTPVRERERLSTHRSGRRKREFAYTKFLEWIYKQTNRYSAYLSKKLTRILGWHTQHTLYRKHDGRASGSCLYPSRIHLK